MAEARHLAAAVERAPEGMSKKKAAEHEEDGNAEIAEAEDLRSRSQFVGNSAHIQPEREMVGKHQQTSRRAQKVRSGQSLLLSHLSLAL